MGGDVLIHGWSSWWCYGGAGNATPSETEPIKRHTRQQGLFTNNLFFTLLLLPTAQPAN